MQLRYFGLQPPKIRTGPMPHYQRVDTEAYALLVLTGVRKTGVIYKTAFDCTFFHSD